MNDKIRAYQVAHGGPDEEKCRAELEAAIDVHIGKAATVIYTAGWSEDLVEVEAVCMLLECCRKGGDDYSPKSVLLVGSGQVIDGEPKHIDGIHFTRLRSIVIKEAKDVTE